MPWLGTAPVEQRERFIADHRRGLYTMAELSAHDRGPTHPLPAGVPRPPVDEGLRHRARKRDSQRPLRAQTCVLDAWTC